MVKNCRTRSMHRKSLEAAEQLKDDDTVTSNPSEKDGNEEEDEDEEENDENDDDDDDDMDEESSPQPRPASQPPKSDAVAKKSNPEPDIPRSPSNEEQKPAEEEVEPAARPEEMDTTEEARFQDASPRHPYTESAEAAHLRIRQEIQSQMEQHHAAVLQLAASSRTDTEEFRNNSIACLRAKAQEHNAKLFSLSADALMFVNNNAAAAAAFLHRSSLAAGMPPHYDANANNLPNIHGYYQSNHHHHHQEMAANSNDIVTSSDSSPIF